jgi:hypothetical protein
MDGFGTGIDMWDLWLLLHPKWNEAPSSHRELALAVPWINPNDRDLIRRRDCGLRFLAQAELGHSFALFITRAF